MKKEEEFVVLVNEKDQEIGIIEKIEAHKNALLHRAFSVFVFNTNRELLLQQRALDKYHSGGLWTNTCCSHPRPNEQTKDAAHRRLHEEMGFDCSLEYGYNFTYKALLDNNLTEHEVDHVFWGISDEAPKINPEEVASYRYISLHALEAEIQNAPEQFTEWFKIIFKKTQKKLGGYIE